MASNTKSMADDTPPKAEDRQACPPKWNLTLLMPDRYSSAIVTITVGTDSPKKFYIHENILKASSPFFTAVLNKRWSEGKAMEVSLPDDEAPVFAIYADWLYQRAICASFENKPNITKNDHDEEWASLSKLYVLAEKIQDDECCDATMSRMIKRVEEPDANGSCWYPSGVTATRLYNGTLPGAPVRKFLVEVHRAKGKSKWIPEASECNHIEFLADLVKVLLDDRTVKSAENCFSSRKKEFLKKG